MKQISRKELKNIDHWYTDYDKLKDCHCDGRITELFLCESHRLILRPNTPYIFKVDPTCEKCVEMAKINKEIEC